MYINMNTTLMYHHRERMACRGYFEDVNMHPWSTLSLGSSLVILQNDSSAR